VTGAALAVPSGAPPTARPQACLFRVEGLTKSWPARPRPVLEDVDLAAPPGTLLSIAGANGVGKTTLLRILAGAIRPDSGVVRLGGLDSERQRAGYQARIGYLAAGDRGLYARLSVREQLAIWTRLAFVPRRRRPAAVAAALERFDLVELADQRVERLSLGQRQRVRLALAFAHEPSVVLLDEPLTSLDPDGARTVTEAITLLRAGGGVCLWASPEPPQIGVAFDERRALVDGRLEHA
jgi:ABC-type multidrug transport system ATPase subunit